MYIYIYIYVYTHTTTNNITIDIAINISIRQAVWAHPGSPSRPPGLTCDAGTLILALIIVYICVYIYI